jgi:hypothetical protein
MAMYTHDGFFNEDSFWAAIKRVPRTVPVYPLPEVRCASAAGGKHDRFAGEMPAAEMAVVCELGWATNGVPGGNVQILSDAQGAKCGFAWRENLLQAEDERRVTKGTTVRVVRLPMGERPHAMCRIVEIAPKQGRVKYADPSGTFGSAAAAGAAPSGGPVPVSGAGRGVVVRFDAGKTSGYGYIEPVGWDVKLYFSSRREFEVNDRVTFTFAPNSLKPGLSMAGNVAPAAAAAAEASVAPRRSQVPLPRGKPGRAGQ